MPKRKRNVLVWSIQTVCEHTSFARTVVEHLMERNLIRSFVYQKERVTTPEAVDQFLTQLLEGTLPTISIGGRDVFVSQQARPLAEASVARGSVIWPVPPVPAPAKPNTSVSEPAPRSLRTPSKSAKQCDSEENATRFLQSAIDSLGYKQPKRVQKAEFVGAKP